jgi:hypothetical protein
VQETLAVMHAGDTGSSAVDTGSCAGDTGSYAGDTGSSAVDTSSNGYAEDTVLYRTVDADNKAERQRH